MEATLAKFGSVIAGFVGSILSLTFLKHLTRKQAMMAVLIGFSCSQFTAPFVVAFFKLPGDADSRYGVAFLIGLLAMNLIPAVKSMLEGFIAKQGN